MNPIFCAEQSSKSGVDIIGSAPKHQVYVAIECPPPWESSVLESKGIPDNLRSLGKEITSNYDSYQTRFLLIHNDQLKQENFTRVLIFRKPSGFATVYDKQEFHLATIQDVAPLVKQYLIGEPVDPVPISPPTRDLLVCTHGSRDRCCSRFGNPIYQQARKLVTDLGLEHTRIWQASHIGGHRMAPTAIDFPTARYYGYLDADSFRSVLTHSGNIQCMATIYRGWGLLPWAAQVLEKQLMLTHGWNWLNYPIIAKILNHNEDESFNQVELTCQLPGDELQTYRADVVADESGTVQVKGSCANEVLSSITPYRIHNLTVQTPSVTLNPPPQEKMVIAIPDLLVNLPSPPNS